MTGQFGNIVTGREVKVGDRVNFGYPQIGYRQVVAIEPGLPAGKFVPATRYAVCDDGVRYALFATQRSYSIAGS